MEVDPIEDQDNQSKQQSYHSIAATQPVAFEWGSRWLKGHQYAFILKNIDAYSRTFGFQKFQYKTHPSSIYQNPINGTIYFVKGKGVGPDFGFPRVAAKKRFRWKKMNFTTDLPKKKSHVTYVVASAIKSQQIEDPMDMSSFRMHAVIPYKERLNEYQSEPTFILCHVRKVEKKKNEQEAVTLQQCFNGGYPDFYKLFSYLNNFSNMEKSK